MQPTTPAISTVTPTHGDVSLIDLLMVLLQRWKLLVLVPVLVGAAGLGVSYLIPPQFTATVTFLPPQGGSSSLSNALNSLGALASLAGGSAGGGKTSADTYVSLLQSRTVADRMIDKFKLQELYKREFRFETREVLRSRSRISLGKKDGLITIEVDDASPDRAAQIANQYVVELKELTSTMALTDAQRRRAFFENQLQLTKARLTAAQQALESSGFNPGALRSEPRAAAEEYGRIKAELTTTEVRLQSLRSRLADGAPELNQLSATAAALRSQLRTLEQRSEPLQNQDYISKYREFKYQETLFEQLGRQFETARLEESLDNTVLQIIDPAQVPEWKSKPKRAFIAASAAVISLLLLCLWIAGRHIWRSVPRKAALAG